MQAVHERLQEIFRTVFYDDSLVIAAETSASDIAAWNSLEHIHLVVAIEEAFGVKFRLAELNELRNVGDMEALIALKLDERHAG